MLVGTVGIRFVVANIPLPPLVGKLKLLPFGAVNWKTVSFISIALLKAIYPASNISYTLVIVEFLSLSNFNFPLVPSSFIENLKYW